MKDRCRRSADGSAGCVDVCAAEPQPLNVKFMKFQPDSFCCCCCFYINIDVSVRMSEPFREGESGRCFSPLYPLEVTAVAT